MKEVHVPQVMSTGLFVENKIVGAAFTVSTLSILGLPLFLGFVVKLNVLISFISLDKFKIVIFYII